MLKKKYDERLISSLRVSETKEKVEETFCLFNIANTEEKIAALEEAMYSPRVFYSSGENIKLAHRYELTLGMFLSGSWKLYPVYQQIEAVAENAKN